MKGSILKLDLDDQGPMPPQPSAQHLVKAACEPQPLCVAPPPQFDDDPWEEPPEYLTDCPCGWEEDDRWVPDHALEPLPLTGPSRTDPDRRPVAALYIDADNQSAQSAADLIALFREDLGIQQLRAVIAGNNSGRQIQLWADELAAAAPGIEAIALDCPSRKNAADLALIMELGANLAGHRRDGDLVVVVSRDDLLVGAAERAKSQGCRALAAYVDSDPPCCRSSRVATLLLPTPAKTRAPLPAPRRLISTLPSLARQPATPAPAGPSAAPPAQHPAGDPATILTRLRELCKPLPTGGYRATDVGQALQKLGLDEKARRRFLATAAGIRTEGAATDKVYRFEID